MFLFLVSLRQTSTLLLSILIVTGIIINFYNQIKIEFDRLENKKLLKDSKKSYLHEKCLINVHGLHHSGTGFLRYMIVKAMGETMISEHKSTQESEDEGQHIQSVYPCFQNRLRNPKLCTSKEISREEKGILYYCPKLTDTVINEGDRIRLFDDWSTYWDMSKPFLIQKTPMMDVLLLERLKVTPTFHAIVMRHPFNWRHRNGSKGTDFPIVWLDVWTNTLEALLNGYIENFAVVNYEMMVASPDDVLEELHSMVTDSCPFPTNQRRQMYMHKNDNILKYTILNRDEKRLWTQCEHDEKCATIMKEMEPIISELGYSWNQGNFFHRTKLGKDKNTLFSPQKIPDAKLVEQMKKLLKKYIK